MEFSSQSVHAVCEGVQAPHGKIQTLCHGAHAVGMLNQDNMPPTWHDSIIYPTENYRETKNKKDMPSHLKAFLRIRKQLKLKQGMLYRKFKVSNNSRARLQLVLPIEYRHKPWQDAMIRLDIWDRIGCWSH